MGAHQTRYQNSKFCSQKILVDGNFYTNCDFENCLLIVEKGETDLRGCTFRNCKLMLKGNAYTVGRIIKLFTGKSPLKVLDFDEPLFEEPAKN